MFMFKFTTPGRLCTSMQLFKLNAKVPVNVCQHKTEHVRRVNSGRICANAPCSTGEDKRIDIDNTVYFMNSSTVSHFTAKKKKKKIGVVESTEKEF